MPGLLRAESVNESCRAFICVILLLHMCDIVSFPCATLSHSHANDNMPVLQVESVNEMPALLT